MNKTIDRTELGMIRLAVRADRGADFLERTSEQIRRLPAVARVRRDPHAAQLEILFHRPAPGLLREVHLALKAAGTDLVASQGH